MTQKPKRVLEWIRRAESDLQYAQAGERETHQHHITCFLCQQAVEKLLKGLLVAAGQSPERTHSLGRLATFATPSFPTLAPQIPDIRKLDKYYTAARYPDDLTTEFTSKDAKEALRIATAVLEWIYAQRILA